MILSCSMMEAGPSMRDNHRQRILVLGAHVDEVNVEPINV